MRDDGFTVKKELSSETFLSFKLSLQDCSYLMWSYYLHCFHLEFNIETLRMKNCEALTKLPNLNLLDFSFELSRLVYNTYLGGPGTAVILGMDFSLLLFSPSAFPALIIKLKVNDMVFLNKYVRELFH